MKLSECKHGIIVEDVDGRVGMIVGITNNRDLCGVSEKSGPEFAIPLVKWSCRSEPSGIHSGNIKPFRG